MRRLTLADVEWTISPMPEEASIRGNALANGNDEDDKAAEDDIQAQLDGGNVWAWCTVVLDGTYKGLSSVETLGCCSYASEADFKTPSGHYEDMQQAILDDLQSQAEELCKSLRE